MGWSLNRNRRVVRYPTRRLSDFTPTKWFGDDHDKADEVAVCPVCGVDHAENRMCRTVEASK